MQSPDVVVQQPTVTTTVSTRHYGSGDHGLLLSIIASCIVFWCCLWIGLFCTIPAIFVAISVSCLTLCALTMAALGQSKHKASLLVYRCYLLIYLQCEAVCHFMIHIDMLFPSKGPECWAEGWHDHHGVPEEALCGSQCYWPNHGIRMLSHIHHCRRCYIARSINASLLWLLGLV